MTDPKVLSIMFKDNGAPESRSRVKVAINQEIRKICGANRNKKLWATFTKDIGFSVNTVLKKNQLAECDCCVFLCLEMEAVETDKWHMTSSTAKMVNAMDLVSP